MEARRTETEAALGRARELLQTRFGHADFLPGQIPPLASILAGRDVLVVMPTGAGKSLLYQLPALAAGGLTLVVSPLISLMKDQVDELLRKGIPATYVNSSLPVEEQRQRMAKCASGAFPLLYVAPERFRNASFLSMLERVNVSRMAVDEAHCISEWGHDFRPDYLRLQAFRERMGSPRVSALTATATRRVQEDILDHLGLRASGVDLHVRGFDRPNLLLRVAEAPGAEAKTAFLLDFAARERGAGIVYTGTRRSAEEVADLLKAVEPRTGVYHAGLEPGDRAASQEAFLSGTHRIVVATTAFGMGIDKADVRFVVHYNFPGSVEQYYQEIGRAGRDGKPSKVVLLYAPGDYHLRQFFIDLNYPPPDSVRAVYETLFGIDDNPVMMTYGEIASRCGDVKEGQVGAAVRLFDEAGVTSAFTGAPRVAIALKQPAPELLPAVRGPMQLKVLEGLSYTADLGETGRKEIPLRQLCAASGLSDEQVRRALSTLDKAGLIDYEPPFRGRGIEKRLDPPLPFAELPLDWERHDRLRKAEEEKLARMEDYILRASCRRGYILAYFGETDAFRCGTCDLCAGAAGGPEGPGVMERKPRTARAVLVCVRHLRFPVGKVRLAQVVTGSRQKEILQWSLDRNPAYGRVKDSQEEVKAVIGDLTREGYLCREGERGRPVLALTERGAEAVRGVHAESLPEAGGGEESEKAGRDGAKADGGEAHETVSGILEGLVEKLLSARSEEAKRMLPALRLFHPGELARRLAARYEAARGARARSRAVWATGELAGAEGLSFLCRAASSESDDLRRLAASALGKAARGLPRADGRLEEVRKALAALADDPASQVRQYAGKALGALDGASR